MGTNEINDDAKEHFCCINERTIKMNEEFRKLAQPLVEYLRKHYHPHARIIIDYESAEIVEGVLTEPFPKAMTEN